MPLFNYLANVVRVVDGDTVDMSVDVGFRIYPQIRLRLVGINAPERYAEGGAEATEYLKTLLPVGSQVTIKTFKNPVDKYGRWLSSVYVGTENINEAMVTAGHAVIAKS